VAGKLRITLVKSPISHTSATRGTVRALGLHRLGETVEVADNPQTRGMARAIRFLVQTEEIGTTSAPAESGDRAAESSPGSAGEPTGEDRPATAKRTRVTRKKEESTA
jgi:large subunit ribosomal protein L30